MYISENIERFVYDIARCCTVSTSKIKEYLKYVHQSKMKRKLIYTLQSH
jgi:hypothetical protein